MQVLFGWRSFSTTWYWVILVGTLKELSMSMVIIFRGYMDPTIPIPQLRVSPLISIMTLIKVLYLMWIGHVTADNRST